MPLTTASYQLKDFHELKMSGSFDGKAVASLLRRAARISLGQAGNSTPQSVPIQDVDLYDVFRRDTGRRIRVGGRYDDSRVYEHSMRKLNTAPITGRFAVLGAVFEDVGTSNPGAQIDGYLKADNLHIDPEYPHRDAVVNYLDDHGDSTANSFSIYGKNISITEGFAFGEPEFYSQATVVEGLSVVEGSDSQADRLVGIGRFITDYHY